MLAGRLQKVREKAQNRHRSRKLVNFKTQISNVQTNSKLQCSKVCPARFMIYYFYGENTYAARQAIDELAKEQQARVRLLDREDFEDKAPADWLRQGVVGLFGSEVVVVRGVGDLPKGLQKDVWEAVREGEGGPASPTGGHCVLWDRGKPDRRSVIFKGLKTAAREFALPEPREAIVWLAEEAKQRDGEIENEAARLLVDRVGVDGWRLISELEKLLLGGKKVTASMVEQTVPPIMMAEIFSMLEALTAGDKKQAVKSVEVLLAGGDNEFYILSMLAYQFRTLLKVRVGIDRGKGQIDVARDGGMKLYSVQKNWQHARRFSQDYLRTALTKILATDFAIKRGKVDQRTALLMLVLGLVK